MILNGAFKNIEAYNPSEKGKILIAFDEIIGDMLSNKKLNKIVNELFIRGGKIFLLFLSHNLTSLFQKKIILNSTHYFIMKFPDQKGLQQTAYNHSSNIYKNVLQTIFLSNY